MSESYPDWSHRTVRCTNKEEKPLVETKQIRKITLPATAGALNKCLVSLPGSLTLLPYLAVLIPGLGAPTIHSNLVWSPRICSYGFLQLSICPWSVPVRPCQADVHLLIYCSRHGPASDMSCPSQAVAAQPLVWDNISSSSCVYPGLICYPIPAATST